MFATVRKLHDSLSKEKRLDRTLGSATMVLFTLIPLLT